MAKEYNQCKGITSKGERCKINAPGGYCHYHVGQGKKKGIIKSPSKATSARTSTAIQPTNKCGYIYVYTLTKLLHNNDEKLLKVRNLPNVSHRHKDKWVSFKAGKSPYMLIKVGMTTQTVQKRLKQWQDKCHHDLTCLYPCMDQENPSSKSMELLIYRLKRLTMKPEKVEFQTFQEKNLGFFCFKGVNLAESEIHSMLHKKYGSGDVYCTGCSNKSTTEQDGHKSKFSIFKDKSSRSNPFQKGYNIHVEWFLIPKKDLNSVYNLIDAVCAKYR